MNGAKRVLIVYASRPETGNSRKVAEAVHEALKPDSHLAPVSEAPDPEPFDFVILGFGVYNGWPDEPMRKYMKRCIGKNVGIFITLGAYPDSEQAYVCRGRAEGLLDSCKVKAHFICHGRLDPALVQRAKERPMGSPHSWTPERAARIVAAESHPDGKDLENAETVFRTAWEKIAVSCQ